MEVCTCPYYTLSLMKVIVSNVLAGPMSHFVEHDAISQWWNLHHRLFNSPCRYRPSGMWYQLILWCWCSNWFLVLVLRCVSSIFIWFCKCLTRSPMAISLVTDLISFKLFWPFHHFTAATIKTTTTIKVTMIRSSSSGLVGIFTRVFVVYFPIQICMSHGL